MEFESGSGLRSIRRRSVLNVKLSIKVIAVLDRRKVLATVNVSRGDDGTIFVQGGGSYKAGEECILRPSS